MRIEEWRAFEKILIGGNHLASSLIGIEMPNNFTNYEDALKTHGQPYADMWIAWDAIIKARDLFYADGGPK